MSEEYIDKIRTIADFILTMIYPDRCIVCDEVISFDSPGICKSCQGKLVYITTRCFKCGKELYDERMEYCPDCMDTPHKFYRGFPLYVYNDGISKSIYRFKYGNRRRYAKVYGNEMANRLGAEIMKLKPDALIPVPLHKKKLKKRGYNQAKLIADELGKRLCIPVIDDYVVRDKNTTPLKLLNRSERQNNLKKAFKIGRNDVKLNSIVIVDDIYTTGSTVDEISGILLDAGVKKVSYVSLASGSNI